MRSSLPKVLHPLAGRSLLSHVIASARALSPETIIVVHGHGGEQVKQQLDGDDLLAVEQREQRGTAHAVAQALPYLSADMRILVLYADVPLIEHSSLTHLLANSGENTIALLTCELDDPTGYGRILRDDSKNVIAIVEHKDASETQRAVREINTGIMVIPAAFFQQAYPRIKPHNAQNEYYLTDIIGLAVADGCNINAVAARSSDEILGVNDRIQLAHLERIYQMRIAHRLMRDGASLADPSRVDVRGRLNVGSDVEIDVNVVFEGDVQLADGVRIGANCVIKNAFIGSDSVVASHSVIEQAVIGSHCHIGPFARLRPGSVLHDHSRVGNFVETKQATIGSGSKVNHLSYVGDAELGSNVNIGAGTITCNYDGANKHKTVIGDDAFIGSNTALVAPLTVGNGATIGAGSTINRDAPAGELTLARAKQQTLSGWRRPRKHE